jgi:hypothetical protein
MRHIVRAVMVTAVGLGASATWNDRAEAQQAPPASTATRPAVAPPALDPEIVLDRAKRALADGRAVAAITMAEEAMQSADKGPRNTARAFAIRGEARLALDRPVEALSDLDSALWIKDGLSSADRDSASAARARAVQKVGAVARKPAEMPPTVPSKPIETATARAPVPVPPPAPAPVQALRPVQALQPVQALPPVQAPAPVASTRWSTTPAREAPAANASSWSVSAKPQPAPSRPDQSETPAATEASGSGNTVVGFLSSLFGGGDSGAGQTTASTTSEPAVPRRPPSPPTTTASIPAPIPRPPVSATSSFEPQRAIAQPVKPVAVDGRAPQSAAAVPVTRTAMAPPPPVKAEPSRVATPVAVAPAAVTPATSPAPVIPESVGTYRLQLGAVRTKEEAQSMAEQARRDGPGILAGRNFEISEDVYGNMGRFYRVRIGMFHNPTDSLEVCMILRRQGIDCMVLDQ